MNLNITHDSIVNTISTIYMIMNNFNLRLIDTINPIISKTKLVIGTRNNPTIDSSPGIIDASQLTKVEIAEKTTIDISIKKSTNGITTNIIGSLFFDSLVISPI